MPLAILSVVPMPEPVSRYQPPLAARASIPATCHSVISRLWVPLSSARDANGACREAIFANAPTDIGRTACSRRVVPRTHQYEVVVHHLMTLDNRTRPPRSALLRACDGRKAHLRPPRSAVRMACPVPTGHHAQPRCRSDARKPEESPRRGRNSRWRWSRQR